VRAGGAVRLLTAGTGTAAPHPRRASAAHWVECGGVRLLMDCGAGALHRLAEFGAAWSGITHLALTHFHLDHVGEVPALLFALKYASAPARRRPLTIIGPEGTRALLGRMSAAHGEFVLDPGFSVEVVEVGPRSAVGGGPVALEEGVELRACPVPHTAESVAFSVATPAGRLVYTGDTGPGGELAAWARGCDLLLAECSLPDAMALQVHLTPRQAGELGRGAEAKRLVLTHLYPPVEEVPVAELAGAAYGGPVTVAADGMTIELGGA
jgi:ribonuclease BN (tRNA processing enzyme)